MDAVQDAVFDIHEKVSDTIMARILYLDSEYHEHDHNCEMRCPRQALRKELLDALDHVGRACEPYFPEKK